MKLRRLAPPVPSSLEVDAHFPRGVFSRRHHADRWPRIRRAGPSLARGNCRPRAIPGSNINVGERVSITITAVGMTTSPCRLPPLPAYARSVRAGESLDRQVERLRDERKPADRRLSPSCLQTRRSAPPTTRLIALAHRVFPYTWEGQQVLLANIGTPTCSSTRSAASGQCWAGHGFFANAEEVFHLTPLRARGPRSST